MERRVKELETQIEHLNKKFDAMIEVLSEFIYDHEERAEKLAERLGNLEEGGDANAANENE
ncbi:MAG: hypothetical protein VX866_10590 [Pseudomonadota bacterium]|jgi:uncharacterized coiled-coil protein SlyX|nr:hypothetical protein [Pseudomonadota bacterium]|tara:strand:- start:561 stop:743 length:183 start_codon:yes stop_codon:yes gene_type:complete